MSTAVLLLGAALAAAEASIVVMPPDGPEEAGWIGLAVAELMPRALQRVGVPAVERADRLRMQEELGVPVASATRATAIRLAETLGAERLVVGVFALEGDRLSLSLRLVDVRQASLSAPLAASGAVEELGRLVHSLAWDVALAGSRPPLGTRAALVGAGEAIPFLALRDHARALALPDPADRLTALRRVTAAYPRYLEACLALARQLLDAREYAEARRVIAAVPDASPFARTARFLDGVALFGLGLDREAAQLYAALVDEEPSATALANGALARLRLPRASPSPSSLLRRAVEMEPAAPDLAFNLGWALLLEGDAEAAAFWLRGVLSRDPRDHQTRLLLSWALRGAGRAEEAEREWEQLAAGGAVDPSLRTPDLKLRFERVQLSERAFVVDAEGRSDAEMAATYAARGERRLQSGEMEEAVAELARAALLDPYSARAHVLLARAHLARGEREKAAAELRMALWCREDPQVRAQFVELMGELGRAEAAAGPPGPP